MKLGNLLALPLYAVLAVVFVAAVVLAAHVALVQWLVALATKRGAPHTPGALRGDDAAQNADLVVVAAPSGAVAGTRGGRD